MVIGILMPRALRAARTSSMLVAPGGGVTRWWCGISVLRFGLSVITSLTVSATSFGSWPGDMMKIRASGLYMDPQCAMSWVAAELPVK